MKVLIISHNPITTQNSMGITFLSLFSQFQREELCQIFIYPTVPNEQRCTSFYRVTDKEVLSSLLKFCIPGEPIRAEQTDRSDGLFENAQDRALYRNTKNKSAFRRLLRDAMWRISRWYSPKLRQWLDQEKPDCIFLAPGAAKFVYNMALRISKDLHIPIVTYVCDEYYFVDDPGKGLERLRLNLLQRKINKTMADSAHLITISQELKDVYTRKFGIPATVIMTGSSQPIAQQIQLVTEPKEICYFGGLRCNRYVSLAQIGRELDELNRLRGEEYKLRIYTFEQHRQILSAFDGIRSIEVCKAVTGKDYEQTFQAAQLLLHVEAFDEASIDLVKHSVSTKIADSLASGKTLLAYAPECVSSIKHLQRTNSAILATSHTELRKMLECAFQDEAARKKAATNALFAASQFHDSRIAGEKLRQVIEKVIEESKA